MNYEFVGVTVLSVHILDVNGVTEDLQKSKNRIKKFMQRSPRVYTLRKENQACCNNLLESGWFWVASRTDRLYGLVFFAETPS